MRCKLYGAGSASVRVTVAVAGLLTALAFLLILFPRSYFASRGAADRLNFARNFLQQFEGASADLPDLIKDGVARNVVYVSNETAAERLGCPVDHTLACFYSFLPDIAELSGPSQGHLISEDDCFAVFRPLPSDHGRGWCVRQGGKPSWLQEESADMQQMKISGSVLLTGQLDGPNPTHQVNLHFHAIWIWMQKQNILPGMLHMLVDSSDIAWSPGKYGTGLGNALGKVQWLPLLDPGLYHFSHLQFSIPDGALFPFDLKHHTIDASVDLHYLELAETIKIRLGCIPPGLAENALRTVGEAPTMSTACSLMDSRKPTVVLARRKEPESRVWSNVEELASELREDQELAVKVVSFGELDFQQQVHTAAAADVLVGVTGSDLVNLMFLPLTGSLVEIFPSLQYEGVFVPELANMAKMLGKNHFTYVSEGNITLDEGRVLDGRSHLLQRTKYINVAVHDLAALVRHAVQQSYNGSALGSTVCSYDSTNVQCVARK